MLLYKKQGRSLVDLCGREEQVLISQHVVFVEVQPSENNNAIKHDLVAGDILAINNCKNWQPSEPWGWKWCALCDDHSRAMFRTFLSF